MRSIEDFAAAVSAEHRPSDCQELRREMIGRVVDRFEEAREFVRRIEEAIEVSAGDDLEDLRELCDHAQDVVNREEEILAFLLEWTVPGASDWGPFSPFGLIRGGVCYTVRDDPGNMRPGIIVRVELDRVVEV